MRPKRLLSACLALALCLGLLPVTALAVGEPATLYVGNKQVISSTETTYWTTDASGTLTQSNENGTWNVKYDPESATLTLSGASIQGGSNTVSAPYGSGIYALSRSGQPVSLTIELIGTNTITGNYGIYVDAQQGGTVGTNASLLIRNSSDNDILEVSGSSHGIYVKSGTGDASLTINDVSVVAKTTRTDSGYAGVYVQSGASATTSPNISLSVNGGSLTASGTESSDGILFYVGSSQATGATTSLTVSDNAIVRANGGIKASRVDEPTPSGTGIVFDGTEGTVYGDVTLGESLTINQGETLTIPDGSKLDCNNNLTNKGTILVETGGTVSGNLSGGTEVTTPSITAQPTDQTVTEGNPATFAVTASDVQSYQWQQRTNSGSDWTNIFENATSSTYTISNTTTDMSGYQYRCVVTSASGVSVTSDVATLTVTEPTTYTITAAASPAEGGNVTVNGSGTSAIVAENSEVTLTATPNSGYHFTGWTSSDGVTFANASSESTTFTMPAGDVTVRAVFSPVVNIPDTHEIELIVGDGGEAKLSLTNASAGSTITVTATPDEGYELAYITVDGERISGTTFKMPDHDVTVRVYFTDGSATLPFTDVSAGAWYLDAVSYVYANGLMDGTSDTTFEPDANMTRAMVWAILARVDGETVTGANWADTAREWAVANGVSDGENASGYVTREQLAAMLYRYAVYKGYDVSIGEDTNILSYADFADLSEYAIPAMQWACGAGIVNGTSESTLTPQGEATRAQVAAMLMRFVEAIG